MDRKQFATAVVQAHTMGAGWIVCWTGYEFTAFDRRFIVPDEYTPIFWLDDLEADATPEEVSDYITGPDFSEAWPDIAEKAARARYNGTPELWPWEETIWYGWDNATEHHEWIATASIAEIIDWAEALDAAAV